MSHSRILPSEVKDTIDDLGALFQALSGINDRIPGIGKFQLTTFQAGLRKLERSTREYDDAPEDKKSEFIPDIFSTARELKIQLDEITEYDFDVRITDRENNEREIQVKEALSDKLKCLKEKVSHNILYSKEDIYYIELYKSAYKEFGYKESVIHMIASLQPESKSVLENFLNETNNALNEIYKIKDVQKRQAELELLRKECDAFLELLAQGNKTIHTLKHVTDPKKNEATLLTFNTRIKEYEKNRTTLLNSPSSIGKKLAHIGLVAAGALLGCVIGAALGLTVGALAVGGAGSVIPVFGNIGGAIAGGSLGAVVGAIKGAGIGVAIATAAASSILGITGGLAAHMANKTDSKRALFTQPKKDLSQAIGNAESEKRLGKQQR